MMRVVLLHLCYDDSEGALVDRKALAINVQSVMKARKLVNVYLPTLSTLELITALYSS
jgi:hypothetical protein